MAEWENTNDGNRGRGQSLILDPDVAPAGNPALADPTTAQPPSSLSALVNAGSGWGRSAPPPLFSALLPWDLTLSAVPRAGLGPELGLDQRAGAVHRARLEHFSGLRLVAESADADVVGRELHAGEVLEIVAAWQRQVASAQAELRWWANQLSRHPRIAAGRLRSDAVERAAAELAPRLGISPRSARAVIGEGASLDGLLWQAGDIGLQGDLDASRTSVLVQELGSLDPIAVAPVLDQVLPVAAQLPPAALRRRVQSVVVQVDPQGETERARSAVAARRVNRVRSLGRGMASFSAVLPLAAARCLEQACEAAARARRNVPGGDHRTLEQLRADALIALGQQALVSGHIGVAQCDEEFSFDPRHARVRIVATPRAQAGLPEQPVTASEVLTSELYGSRGPDHGDGDGDQSDGDGNETEWEGPYGGYVPPTHCRPGIDVPVVLGGGAIPPLMVTALLSRAWVAIDPPAHAPTGPAPPPVPSYTPSVALDAWVRSRDRECQAPGCSVDAWRCDLDHRVAYPAGATAADNLVALCRYHHGLKTHHGHSYEVLPDRTLTWRTPLGQLWTRLPNGAVHEGRPGRDEGPAFGKGIVGDLAAPLPSAS